MRKNAGTEEAIQRWNRFADSYAASHTEQGDIHKEVFLTPSSFLSLKRLRIKKCWMPGAEKDI